MTCDPAAPNRKRLGVPLFPFVFPAGCHAAPDVTLTFIQFQNLPNLCIESRVVFWQPLLPQVAPG